MLQTRDQASRLSLKQSDGWLYSLTLAQGKYYCAACEPVVADCCRLLTNNYGNDCVLILPHTVRT
jgi:hypothetical protein